MNQYQIPMDDLSWVDIFESSKKLIEEELIVLLGEGLITFDNLGQVSVHHLGYNITELYVIYTSSNSYLDLGRIIV